MDDLFANKAQKIALIIITLSFFGLLSIPLFPWFGVEQDRYNWEIDEEKRVIIYEYGNSGFIHMLADTASAPDEFEDIDGDISMISLCFWLSLFFGIIAIAGVAVYRTGRTESIAHILLMIGAIVIVFSILAMIFHATLLVHLGEWEDEMNEGRDPEDESKVTFGYNFIPLIMTVLLLITSIMYMAGIVPHSKRALSWRYGGAGYRIPPQYPLYQQRPLELPGQPQPQPLQPTNIKCPGCKSSFTVKVASFPANVKCPFCGTEGFVE